MTPGTDIAARWLEALRVRDRGALSGITQCPFEWLDATSVRPELRVGHGSRIVPHALEPLGSFPVVAGCRRFCLASRNQRREYGYDQ
jgi:hypothetical protein